MKEYRFYIYHHRLRVDPELLRADLALLTPAQLKGLVMDKWACLLAYHLAHPGTTAPDGVGEHTCAYCVLYLSLPQYCAGCPVARAARTKGCHNTPFVDYLRATDYADPAAALAACQGEVMFIDGLEVG